MLGNQTTNERFTYSIIVSDNDIGRSAENTVLDFSYHSRITVVYCNEPLKNIALARNRAIKNAQGEFIAFIDDDEFPVENWLISLFQILEKGQIHGVLGPVRPHFDQLPPQWVLKGGFCERPEHQTGAVMKWNECRTGNLLFRHAILAGIEEPFDPKFGTGGEDMEFFLKMTQAGKIFQWCSEAIVYEEVSLIRFSRFYMLKRAMLRGKNILKHSKGSLNYIITSMAAVPLYMVVLPIALLGGHHIFMKYCIKLCDHAGRLLALIGLNPVSERDI